MISWQFKQLEWEGSLPSVQVIKWNNKTCILYIIVWKSPRVIGFWCSTKNRANTDFTLPTVGLTSSDCFACSMQTVICKLK